MAEDIKAPEAPVVEKPEAPVDESIIENRRAEVEKKIITENETFPEPELVSETPEFKEESKVEESLDPIKKIKDSVQKRIDKVVAQKKSIQEELDEARAEIERLKSNPKQPEVKTESKSDDKTPPTQAEVKAYIVKMRQEGNVEEEIAAIDYLAELKKNEALKNLEDKEIKSRNESESAKAKDLAEWTDLQRDYVSTDESGKIDLTDDMTLSNQNGLLYKLALDYYNDKERHAERYNNPNTIQGFRRAVADAYRDIHQYHKTPKGTELIKEKKVNPRMALASPDADAPEETTQSSNNSLSDADKVREDIKNRKKNLYQKR